MAADLNGMKNAIETYFIKSVEEITRNRKAHKALVSGGNVIIGNRHYPYVPVVDQYFDSGDTIYAIVTDNGAQAIVVGT